MKFDPHSRQLELVYQPTPERPYPAELLGPGQWIDLLYAGRTAPTGAVEFRLIRKGKVIKEWMPFPVSEDHPDTKKFEDIARWQKNGHDVFFGASLREVEGISGDAGVHPTHLIWADLDMKETAYIPEGTDALEMSPEALRETAIRFYAEAMARCAKSGLSPLVVNYSGHGLQIYFARPVSSTTADTERMNVGLFELFKDMGADRKVKNPERILRVPGSYNLKNPERPLQIEVWHIDADARVQDQVIEALIPTPELRPAAPVVKRTSRAAPVSSDKAKARAEKRRRAEVTAAVNGEAESVRKALDGVRNDTLNIAAVKLARFLPHGELEENELVEVLTAAALAAGLTAEETADTIRSGLTFGTKSPADPERFDAEESEKEAARKATGAAEVIERSLPADRTGLPTAEQIPAPEVPVDDKGKMDYSDAQVIELLGLSAWGVTSPHTEQAHAHRLKVLAKDDLLYVPGMEWAAWNKRHWQKGNAALALARRHTNKLSSALLPETEHLEILASLLTEADREKDAAAMMRAARRHLRAAKAVEENKRQRAVLEMASAHFLIERGPELFSLRPWLLGFQNGALDGVTFREHRREDYMLSLLPVSYEPEADRSDWEAVLGRMTGGDVELARTLQEVAGYALSASSSQRVIFLSYGPARSGKSTFAELLQTVLGDQSEPVEAKHFSGEGLRGLLGARLWNKRLGVCAEAGSVPMNGELLKMLSGGDRYTVKRLYEDEFKADPTHALMLVANDPPELDALDAALRTRVLALPFEYDLDPEEKRDLFGGQELEHIRRDVNSLLVRGFAAWAVEGFIRVYQTRTIYRAPATNIATRNLWQDVGDALTGFWETVSASEVALGINVRELRSRYMIWSSRNNEKTLAPRKWSQACEAVGLVKKSNGAEWIWKWSNPEETWPFDNLTALTTFPESNAREKVKNGAGSDAVGNAIPLQEVAGKIVKTVKLSSTEETTALAPASGEL